MQCPRCKKEINDNSLKCSFCGTKVASVCKKCQHINPINATECSNCHTVLLKICSACGSANLPNAKKCRKCGIEFVSPKNTTKPEYVASQISQQKAKTTLLEAIKSPNQVVITLNGESGSGKNLVLKYAINELKRANVIWLLGSCTHLTQLSPFGYFQDLLLSFFNVNNFSTNTLQLKKNSIKFFKQDFPTLSNPEIIDLLNLLYPESYDKYENIYVNKRRIFEILKKVFFIIAEKMKTIFIIDNFENIDGMSYDFLKELLADDYIITRCKFIILTTAPKPGMGCITSERLTEENYLDISIAPFTQTQIQTMVSQCISVKLDNEFVKIAHSISAGNPAIVEQMVFLQNDISTSGIKYANYKTFEQVVRLRMQILNELDPNAYRMLVALSVLGNKFHPAMLEHFDNNDIQEFERIIEKLVKNGFITQLDNLSFEFKCSILWKTIVDIVKNETIFQEILNLLIDILGMYKQSSIALLAYIEDKLGENDKAFEIWTNLMKQASYIGDVGLYIISQKQSLKQIENKNTVFYTKVKRNIYTRLGKILEPIDTVKAQEYLQYAIMMLGDEDGYEHIELLGYLASASMKNGNYWGVIECADNILNTLPEDGMELERTLIKSRQVRPFLRLGNYGQVINLIDTEVMPLVEKYVSKGRDTSIMDIKSLYYLWLELYFDLAEALTFQGDSRMFDIVKTIFDILDKDRVTDPTILCRAHLSLALANTTKGDINTSNRILDDVLKEFSLDSMDSFVVSRWNFIDILNKFAQKDYSSLYSELFNVVAYANNINDNFTKNILKTLLAKMLRDKNEVQKALEILEEQVTYFAKEKIATGVLLSWYLIAKMRLVTNGTQFALDIANKALDIAQGPSINNYCFIALFNRLIGEIYMAKQDFESAKVYIEKSLSVAQQHGLEDILVKTYILYAKFYQELALPKTTLRAKYVKQAIKMYQLAQGLSIVVTQPFLQKMIKENFGILSAFCRLNGIQLRKATR